MVKRVRNVGGGHVAFGARFSPCACGGCGRPWSRPPRHDFHLHHHHDDGLDHHDRDTAANAGRRGSRNRDAAEAAGADGPAVPPLALAPQCKDGV